MTDMHSLTVFKHPLQISLLDYEAGAKILDRFKKGHTKGTALIAEHGFTLDDAQRKAYKEAMGRAWDKPFDPQFNYSGQRSKADKAIFKNLKE